MFTTRFALPLLLTALCTCMPMRAQEPYFYKPVDYGSMSMFTPWNVVINGSYDIIQLDGKNRHIFDLPYGTGFENVVKNCLNMGATISQIGWGRWLTTEVFPLNFTKEGGQWLPNYQLHLIGGGMTYRMLEEWFVHNKVAAPGAWAVGTMITYHMLNEVVENEGYVGYNSDPIADLLIFDWLGILLFTSDDVSRFFANDLHMADWSNLPMITFPGARLGNNGLYYSLKWTIPGTEDKWSVWYLMGMSNMAGPSYKFDAENSVSVGAGLRGRTLYTVDPRVRILSLNLVPTAGIYWDKNNSLMASLQVSGQEDQTVIGQFYPGILKLGPISPAVWASYGSNGSVGVGIAFQGTIGIGYRDK
ncbi:hypothetical protein BH10BAC6_BH10BAC6_10090 [soil metagenome]